MMKKKTEVIILRLTVEDKAAIQKAAAAEGMSMSEYIRAAALVYMAARLNPHALATALAGARIMMKELGEKFFTGALKRAKA